MSRDPKMSIPTYQKLYQIGASGGTVNTNGMPYQKKIGIDSVVKDGRKGTYKG